MTPGLKLAPILPRVAKSESHGTPPRILDPVRRIFGGTIDLDPCGNPQSLYVVAARRTVMLPRYGEMSLEAGSVNYCLPDSVILADGLEVGWGGNVFVNPPYSVAGGLARFTAKCRDEARTGGADVIALLPSKTDAVDAWHPYVPDAAAVCFIRGRVRYLGNKDGAAFASALVLWTERRGLVRAFTSELNGKLGLVMYP